MSRPVALHRDPVTDLQRRFLGGVPAHGRDNWTLAVAMRVRGLLARSDVERAVADLIVRHESLRTTFRHGGGDIGQTVWSAGSQPLRETDLRERPEALQTELVRIANSDLQVWGEPPWAVDLLTLGARDRVLLVRMHHVISDGWSCGVMWRDLASSILAHAAGRSSPLPPLTASFRDVAAAKAAPLRAADRAYWTGQIGSRTGPHERIAGPPGASWTPRRFEPMPPIPAAVGSQLEALAAKARVSLATCVLAATAASFAGACDELVLAVTHANRFRPELDGIVGPVTDVLPIRVDLTGDPSYEELVGAVHRGWLKGLLHAIPCGRLQEAAGSQVIGPASVADLLFNYVSVPATPGPAIPGPGEGELTFEGVDIDWRVREIRQPSRDALTANLETMYGAPPLCGHIRHGTMPRETGERIAAAIVTTLTRATARPQRPMLARVRADGWSLSAPR